MMKVESSLPNDTPLRTSARSLRRVLIAVVSVSATVLLGLVATAGVVVLKKSVAADEDARIENAAALSKQLVERVLAERARQVDLIASAPSTISAATRGADVSRQNGLTGESMEALEQRFKATRSQQVDGEAIRFLSDLLPKLDIAEVMVTDQYGYNAVTTSLSSDFVQSDEGWWQRAWNDGWSTANATEDKVMNRTVVELARVVRGRANEAGSGAKVGVVKVKFGLSTVDSVLAQGSSGTGTLRVDLVDSTGRIIASSGGGSVQRFSTLRGDSAISRHSGTEVFTYSGDSVVQRAAVAATNAGRWRVIAHMSEAEARAGYRIAKYALIGGVVVMLIAMALAMITVARFVERRITGPAEELAVAAESVAAGDLSRQVSDIGSDDEIGRLARAVSAMIGELRRLAMALNESATETASMTAEITASSEEMAASAGQIAHTASDLSHQSTMMAETIHTLAGSAQSLVGIAGELDAGSHDGMTRNTHLRALAVENRARLDESARSLHTLTTDVEATAAAAEQLAVASEEVGSFVTLVQKLARQSKLLALNAAMEAARAGEHGQGFAVVAEEVRRLAAMSSDAAERTERVVAGVLQGVAQSRVTSERTVATVHAVRGATEQGSKSFGEIEKAVADAEAWTKSIGTAADAANDLAGDVRARLDTLAAGTEAFAAAMQEVAASSEEQSASTQEIAAAASALAHAADRLRLLVANLRLDGNTPPEVLRPEPLARVPEPAPVRLRPAITPTPTS
jgi:methyl-accepting chemotaxis protein